MTAATLVYGERSSDEAAAGDPLKYQLTVVAPTVLDAVSTSGGWLFDRVMAGWDVSVLIPNAEDVRPLAILGARGFELDAVLGSARRGFRPQALAVAADMFDNDDRVSREVLTALGRKSTEVTFWGSDSPANIDRPVRIDEYSLTAAAHAFKCHALALAAAPIGTVVGRTERFFTTGASGRVW